jgi:hypothetical protein
MRGPKPTHPVNLTAEEVKSFQQLIRAHSTPQAVAVRARIILRAYDHAEQEAACEGQLHFQVLWLPPNASWLDQIEIWFCSSVSVCSPITLSRRRL